MASIQKRGKTYQYSISNMENGKQKPIRKGGFKTKGEAKVAAAEMEVQLSRGIVSRLKSVPIDEYFDEWVKLHKSNLSGSTKANYAYTSKIIKLHLKGTSIQKMNKDTYQLFINNLGENKSKATVEKVHTHIRACVINAVENQLIPFDFARKPNLNFTIPAKEASKKHIHLAESELLYQELHTKLEKGIGYYLLLLALTSGLRFSELVGLTRSDFDFINSTISVNKTWRYMKRQGKGYGLTKTEESTRIIKIEPATMAEFDKLFKNSEVPSDNIHQLVFYSESSKYKVISNTAANKLLRNTLKRLNINPITLHGLRHTHTSVLLYNDVSIDYISERLGHSSTNITQKKYTHILKELRSKNDKTYISTFAKMLKQNPIEE